MRAEGCSTLADAGEGKSGAILEGIGANGGDIVFDADFSQRFANLVPGHLRLIDPCGLHRARAGDMQVICLTVVVGVE